MSLSIKLLADELRTIAYGDIDVTYEPIGSALAYPAVIVTMQNLTDVLVTISLDGDTDHFALPAGGYLTFDLCTNKVAQQGAFIATGTTFYAASADAPSSGSVYISVIYQAPLQ